MRNEDGWAILTAVLVIASMMVLGLAAYASADGQEVQAGRERVRESSFNLSEAAISAQVFQLSRSWPGSAGAAYPSSCTPTSTSTNCPNAAGLAANYASSDYAAGLVWNTQVRDNGGSAGDFYNDSITNGQPSYDASGPAGTPDGKVWVRAEATVQGRRRVIVTQVKAGEVSRPFPRNVVTSGWFSISNSGNKVLVDTNGDADQFEPANLEVRCTTPPQSAGCLDYQSTRGQVTPNTWQTGHAADPALSTEARDELRSLAKARGTYYATGCPPTMTGSLVFVENGTCSYKANAAYNSADVPGLFYINRGTLEIGAQGEYHGLIYAGNAQGATAASGAVVVLNANSRVYGAIAVDGQGGVEVGSSGVNLFYDPTVFGAVKGYGAASAVQGSFRELPPG